MSVKSIFEELIQRDYSGSPSDKYAQDLETFHFHSLAQGKESDFFLLFEQAQKKGKKIKLNPSFLEEMSGLMYEDIPFESLIIS